MNLEKLCNDVMVLSKETGHFFLEEIHKVKASDVKEKGLHDFVSYVDQTAEIRIVKELERILPEAGFVAEEGSSTRKGDLYNWVVDPLDGTTNFLHHIPLFSSSIALMRGDRVILGVVNEPNLDECFYAWEGSPAFLNGNCIRVSQQVQMKNALLATGFPYYDYGKLNGYMELFMHFARNTSGLRRLGSAAVDLAYTACGRFEGFYEYGLHAWDVAAGTFVLQQAGGTVTDFRGGNNFLFGGEMLASNTILHETLLSAIREHFIKE